MSQRIFASLVLVLVLLKTLNLSAEPAFIETYPHLKDYIFEEPKSDFYIGFGAAPVGAIKNRMLFTANFFQVHWIRKPWDIEILSASYGFTTAEPSYVKSRHFIFRTAPKFNVYKFFSVGPMLGYELVSFPEISARLYKNSFASPTEPFSTRGIIYGVMVSENFELKNNYIFKLNQVFYKQTYSTERTDEDWLFLYDRRELRLDTTPIQAETVFMLEASLLF